MPSILTVRPGLTDLASLKYIDEVGGACRCGKSGRRVSQRRVAGKNQTGKFYVRHASTILDLAIVTQTILCLLKIPLVVCELPDLRVIRPSQTRTLVLGSLRQL